MGVEDLTLQELIEVVNDDIGIVPPGYYTKHEIYRQYKLMHPNTEITIDALRNRLDKLAAQGKLKKIVSGASGAVVGYYGLP